MSASRTSAGILPLPSASSSTPSSPMRGPWYPLSPVVRLDDDDPFEAEPLEDDDPVDDEPFEVEEPLDEDTLDESVDPPLPVVPLSVVPLSVVPVEPEPAEPESEVEPESEAGSSAVVSVSSVCCACWPSCSWPCSC